MKSDERNIILNSLNDENELFNILKMFINKNEISKNLLLRGLHNLLEINSEKSLQIVSLIKNESNDISYLALKVQILAKNYLFDEAIKLLELIPSNKIKKRFYMPIYESLCKINKNLAFEFMVNNIYQKFRILESELEHIYEIISKDNFEILMKIMADNEIIIKNYNSFKQIKNLKNSKLDNLDKNNRCKFCSKQIIKIPFSIYERNKLIQKLKSTYLKNNQIPIKNLQLAITKKKYNLFIDGNNILFYIDRKICVNSFKRIKSIYEQCRKKYNPLIFLHIRHKDYLHKNLNKNNFKIASNILNSLNENIFYTPYKMNDDWFYLWAGINTPNSFVITNDLLRDHIKNISYDDIITNSLSRWINGYVIKYDFTSPNKCNLFFPLNFTHKIQYSDNNLHIPTDKKWICYIP